MCPLVKCTLLWEPNGSGKSTLSYTIAGRDGYEASDGAVTLEGINVLDLDPDQRAANGLFFIFSAPDGNSWCSNDDVHPHSVERPT